MQTFTKIIKEALYLPPSALSYELSLRLSQVYPHKFILETEDCDFDLKPFVEAGGCQVRLSDAMHPQLEAEWKCHEIGATLSPRNSFQEVAWRGNRFKVLSITYDGNTQRHFVIADSSTCAKAFFAQVCAFSSVVSGEILVYKGGWWHRDKALLNQIASATLDNLVLSDALVETLNLDLAGFFDAREMYEQIGVAWKRGILMLGPPGNGKTHAIKAMVNRIGRPCLYVRTFKSTRNTVAGNIERVFHRARQAAPCMLILEDLDTLIDRANLSFFLNEMDGFASNTGILTVATTNHPEKLDTAILDRPSRFDRKIMFGLPSLDQRRRFLEKQSVAWDAKLRLTDDEIRQVAGASHGFSFAYLKELCLSGLMAWISAGRSEAIVRTMLGQVESLRAQMKSEPRKVVEQADDE